MPPRRDALGPARPSTANKKKRAAKAPTAQGISEVKRPSSALTFSSAPPDKTKQSKLGFDTQPAAKKAKNEQPGGSLLSKGKQREQSPSDDEDVRPSLASARSSLWSAKYAPSERSELAVHPRKVSDVESWLRDAYSGKVAMARYRRLLILTGPAGSGKTETLRQLSRAEELDLDIVEWKSEESGLGTSDEFETQGIMAQFREFMSKTARFNTLSMRSDSGMTGSGQPESSTSSSSTRRRRRLVLLEDLPSLSHAPTLDAFRETLGSVLDQSPSLDNVPVCIVLSQLSSASGMSATSDADAVLLDERESRDSDWVRPERLLGEELSRSPSWAHISFNPIAPTLLKKVLKATVTQASADYTRIASSTQQPRLPGKFPPEVADIIAEDSPGDVRSATDLLQQVFHIWVRQPRLFDSVVKSKTKAAAKDCARDVLSQSGIVSRESTLNLFHSLGRLMYNKRYGDPDDDDDDKAEQAMILSQGVKALPDHLKYLNRRPSKVNTQSLVSSGIEPSMLSLFAHHNYPQFCEDIDQCASIIDAYSLVDASMTLRGAEQYGLQPLIQQYSYLISAQSTLLHLPSPAARRGQRLTGPRFFQIRSQMGRVRGGPIEQLRASMPGGLATHTSNELAEEWLPMVAKMAKQQSKNNKSDHLVIGGSLVPMPHSAQEALLQIGRMDISAGFSSSNGTSSISAPSRREEALEASELEAHADEDEEGDVGLASETPQDGRLQEVDRDDQQAAAEELTFAGIIAPDADAEEEQAGSVSDEIEEF